MKVKTKKRAKTKTNLIDKAKFDKLTREKKIMAICRDVIERLNMGFLKESHGAILANDFAYEVEQPRKSAKNLINSNRCNVCAKGAIFCSWVGNFNEVKRNDFGRVAMDGNGMQYAPNELIDIFDKEMLDNLEAAFEGQTYSWHKNQSLSKEYAKAFAVNEYGEGDIGNLMAYIIECGGTFPLPKGTSFEIIKVDLTRTITIVTP